MNVSNLRAKQQRMLPKEAHTLAKKASDPYSNRWSSGREQGMHEQGRADPR